MPVAKRLAETPGNKVCSICDTEKSEDDFYGSAQGPRQPCKICLCEKQARLRRENPGREKQWKATSARRRREADPEAFEAAQRRRYLLRNYDMTLDKYEEMFGDQGGACAICGHEPDPEGHIRTRMLHVDHNHATGAIRQLLCHRCNTALGGFKDDSAILSAAIEYLARHGGDSA